MSVLNSKSKKCRRRFKTRKTNFGVCLIWLLLNLTLCNVIKSASWLLSSVFMLSLWTYLFFVDIYECDTKTKHLFSQRLVGRAKGRSSEGCNKCVWQRTMPTSRRVRLADCVHADVFQSPFVVDVYLQLPVRLFFFIHSDYKNRVWNVCSRGNVTMSVNTNVVFSVFYSKAGSFFLSDTKFLCHVLFLSALHSQSCSLHVLASMHPVTLFLVFQWFSFPEAFLRWPSVIRSRVLRHV